jgi:3-methyladenine DNA glycosylase/8-oxoguanine DNA glycosylase
MREWSSICSRFVQKASNGQIPFPSASVLSALPLHDLQSSGIDARRARTLLLLAREVRLHPLRPEMNHEQLRLRLGRIPGLRPWSVEMILVSEPRIQMLCRSVIFPSQSYELPPSQ